jgi:predicted Zn-dependent peptidase
VQKWYSDIPYQKVVRIPHLEEPKQIETRNENISSDVPLDAIIKAYHCTKRMHPHYYITDLLCDILGAGRSSRLYNALVKGKKLFSELDCYLSGDIEAGLFIIEGKLIKGVSVEVANAGIIEELDLLKSNFILENDLQKVKNKVETNIRFNDLGVLNKAMKIAYCELLGNVNLVNTEIDQYINITISDILHVAQEILNENNCSTLYYLSK